MRAILKEYQTIFSSISWPAGKVFTLWVTWQQVLLLGEGFKLLLNFCIDRNYSWFYYGCIE